MNSLAVRIFIALLVGLSLGIVLSGSEATPAIIGFVGPLGRAWLDALTMTVVPLVFSLLVVGILGSAGSSVAGRVTFRALAWFSVLLLSACCLSAAVVTLALHIWPVPPTAGLLRSPNAPPVIASAGAWLAGIVPSNPIKAAAETAILPLVIFALLFGFAACRIEPVLRTALQTFFQAIVQTMLVVVHWVLLVGPLGIFALAFGMASQVGIGALGLLAQYIVIVIAACLAITASIYAVMWAVGTSPMRFARAVLPVQIVALSTQSSLATLPTMIKAAKEIGSNEEHSAVVLPLAVSIFRAASAGANVAVAVYLAHLYGHSLSITLLVAAVMVAAPVSLAAVGLPAQISYFATIGPVCLAIGVPLDLLPLLLAVETLPDVFRTLGNTTADVAMTRLVDVGIRRVQ